MKHEDLIAQFLASGGTIQKCPPRTFSQDASAPLSWKETQESNWRRIRRVNRFEAAKRKRREPQPEAVVVEVLTPVHPLPQKPVVEAVQPRKAMKPAAAKDVKQPKPAKMAKPREKRAKLDPAQFTVAGFPLRDVVEMIRGGMTAVEVASKLGTSKNTICGRLHKAGIKIGDLRPVFVRPVQPRQSRYSEAMVRDALQGRTRVQAAAHLGTSPRHLQNLMERYGVGAKRAIRSDAQPIEPVVDAIRGGMTIREAAAHFGVSPSTIMSRLKARGLSVASIMGSPVTGAAFRRGANVPEPCIIGGHEWPSRADAAAELGVHPTTLGGWLQPGAGKRKRASLAAAVMAWEAKQRGQA